MIDWIDKAEQWIKDYCLSPPDVKIVRSVYQLGHHVELIWTFPQTIAGVIKLDWLIPLGVAFKTTEVYLIYAQTHITIEVHPRS